MTAEGWTIIGATIALVGIFAPVLMGIRRDLTDLCERMARLEGLFEGFIRRDEKAPSHSA